METLITDDAIDQYCLALALGLKKQRKIREEQMKIRAKERSINQELNDARQKIGDLGLGFIAV